MKYLIFDMDGTLIDSMAEWDRAHLELLEKFEIPLESLPPDLQLDSKSFEEVADILLRYAAPGTRAEDIIRFMDDQTDDFYRRRASLEPGVLPFLEALRAKNVGMSVATSTDSYQAEKALELCGLRPFFEHLFSNDLLGSSKADDEFWEQVSEKTGYAQNEMILFDDAPYALNGARKAGLMTVALRDLRTEEEFLSMKERADLAVNGIADLDVEEFYNLYIAQPEDAC